MKSLSGKVLLIVITYCVTALGLVSVLTGAFLSKDMDLENERMAVSLATGLAACPTLLTVDPSQTATLVESLFAARNLSYLLVLPEGGAPGFRKLAPDLETRALDALPPPASGLAAPSVARVRLDGVGDVLDITAPLLPAGKGILRLGINLEADRGHIAALTGRMLPLVGAVFLLGLVPVFFSLRRISRPLRELSDHAERIATGDHFSTVSVRAADEIGVLAKAMNHMVYTLWDKISEVTKAEEQYRSIFENMAEGLFRSTPDGRFVLVNPALARMLGYGSPQQLLDEIKDSYTDLYLRREDREAFVRYMLSEGRVKGFEVQVKRRDGTVTWISLSAHTVLQGRAVPPVFEGLVEDIAERKRAEYALRASEANYREFVEKANISILIIQDKVIGYANPCLQAVSGYDAGELCGGYFLDFIAPEDKTLVAANHGRRLTGEPVAPYDARLITKDGSLRWMEISAVLGHWEGRDATLAVLNDIHQRELAARTVKASEEKYRMLVDKVNVGIMVIQDGIMKYLNPRHLEVTGYSEAEVIGKPFVDFTHPDDVKTAYANHCKRVRGERVEPYLLRIIARDGTLRWLEVDGLIGEWEGQPAGINFLNDVTARVLTDQALQTRERQFRTLVESANVSILVLQDGVVRYANPHHAEVIGYSQEESLGTPFLELVYEDDRSLANANFLRRQAGEHVPTYLLRTVAKDGTIRWKDVTGTPMEWEGRPAALVFLNDVTERELAAKALAASETQYRNVVERANVSIMVIQDELIKYSNPRASLDSGYSPEELLNTRYLDYTHPEDRDIARENYIMRLAGEHRDQDIVRIVAKDGSIRWLEVSGVAMEWEGRPAALVFLNDVTERERAAKALAASERQYRELVQNANSIILRWGLDGRIIFINAFGLQYFGYEENELLGRSVLDTIVPATESSGRNLELMIENITRDPDAYSVNANENRRKDGAKVWVNWGNKGILDENGRLVEVLSVGTDETERMRAERELRASESRYRSLVENIPLGVAVIGQDMRIQSLNPAMQAWFPDVDEATRPLCYEAYNDPPRDAPCVYCPTLKTLRDGRVHEAVTETPRGDEVRRFRIVSTPIRDHTGSVVAALEAVEDITERSLAEEALRRSEQKYRTLLHAIPQKIIYKDAHSTYLAVNSSFARDYGLKPEELVGMDDFSLYPETLAEKYRADDRRVMTSGMTQEYDEEYVVHDRTMIVHTLKAPVLDAGGHAEGVLTIFWDVTSRKLAEEALRRAEKMEAIGTLAGGIAHDFNNILGAIVNLTTLAKRQLPSGSRTVLDLDQVLQSAERGKSLVRQILTFSRPEGESRKPFPPGPIVREVLGLLRPSLPAAITIRETIAETTRAILGDPVKFHQVVLNLCTNAIDALLESGGVITVSLQQRTVAPNDTPPHPSLGVGSYLELRVEDTGPGIPAQVQERIFEPFFTTKCPGRGTGLGLAVVHGIVTQHGGAVILESAPDRGTTFRVFFPIHAGQSAVAEAQQAEPAYGKGHILFVDDEQTLARSSALLLESYGYTVTMALSGQEALDIFRQKPAAFDLVITDLTMPDMNGKDLAMTILGLRPNLPIILCTGFSESLSAEEAYRLGISEYAYKPVDWDALSATIDRLLALPKKE